LRAEKRLRRNSKTESLKEPSEHFEVSTVIYVLELFTVSFCACLQS